MSPFRIIGKVFHTSPFLAQCGSCVLFFSISDTIAQTVFEDKPHQLSRTLRMALYGGLIFGPVQNRWQAFANRYIHFPTKLKTALARTFIEQTLVGPSIVSMFFFSMGLMEEKNVDRAAARVQMKWWDTITKGWALFVPFSFLNFVFVPMHLRTVSGGFVSLNWNIYMSYVNSHIKDARHVL